MFRHGSCTGNYLELQGHNKKLEDAECLVIGPGSKVGSVINSTATSCRWWYDKGKKWLPCSENPLTKPKTWRVENGLCEIVEGTTCDNWNDVSATYGSRQVDPPCIARKHKQDPVRFQSMKCYIG